MKGRAGTPHRPRQFRRIVLFGALLLLPISAGPAPAQDIVPPSNTEAEGTAARISNERLGGPLSHDRFDRDAYRRTRTDLTAYARAAVERGERIFRADWVPANSELSEFRGLGPLYNRVGCTGCHDRGGRGRAPFEADEPLISMLVRISVGNADGTAHPVYGSQIQDRALPGTEAEARPRIRFVEEFASFPDGEAYALRRPELTLDDWGYGPPGPIRTSLRVAPQLIGLGLLEAVPLATLRALADPQDADGDGISGRLNRLAPGRIGATRFGRFGWKAGEPDIEAQNANALSLDIGITTPAFPHPACTPEQTNCLAAAERGRVELNTGGLQDLAAYIRAVLVPEQRKPLDPEVQAGARLFADIGCAACHIPTLETAAGVRFHPFTDLLLHDMGAGLADDGPEGGAAAAEWRTPPLWGLGLQQRVNGHMNLLHDGRARGFAEAILWHGGEAKSARDRFHALPKADRAALIAFLESL